MKKKFIPVVLIIILSGFLIYRTIISNQRPAVISGYEDCVLQSGIILESYPPQCRTPEGRLFTKDIGSELEKMDLIVVENPRPNTIIRSPLEIRGKARGIWFFEAVFEIRLVDEQNRTIASTIAMTDDQWMSEEFVDFSARLTFENPGAKEGKLIFEKANPSDMPQNSDELIIPVVF